MAAPLVRCPSSVEGGRRVSSAERRNWWRLVSSGLLLAVACAWALGFLDFVSRTVRGTYVIVDFRVYDIAARAVLHGHDPYLAPADAVRYVYPPLTALAAIPFAPLPVEVASGLAVLSLTVAMVGVLLVLGVRDWRCYVLALCWRPVLFGILTGNVSILVCLGVALAWRFRDRILPLAGIVGAALAAKLFVWPLVVWLAASRRNVAAVLSCLIGTAVVLGSWAVIGFTGLREYPALLGRAQQLQERATYSIYALGRDLGLPSLPARALGIAILVVLLAGVLSLGARGRDRDAFVLAVAASLAFTPIVWLHYFALLAVVVALTQPTLGPAWFVPLAMWFAPGVNGSPAQKALVLGVAGATVALSLAPSLDPRLLRVRLERLRGRRPGRLPA